MKFLKELIESIYDYIFPKFCINCGEYGKYLCDKCFKHYKYQEKQRCFVCDNFSTNGITHIKCKNEFSPNQLFVVSKYGQIEKKLVHRLKYGNCKESAKVISDLMIVKIKNLNLKNYVICPIPLHYKKLKQRGYNQVEIIAEDLKEYLKNIEIKNLLVRKKNTIAQNKLNRKERIENLKDAFEINRKEFDKFHKDVALLDDLTTSGSTFREATKVLKENGVKNVICIAFARGK